MNELLQFVRMYGAPVIFLVVCPSQIGLPLPGYPTIIAACALCTPSVGQLLLIASMSMAGALTADALWFICGRRYGPRLLNSLNRTFPSTSRCLHATEQTYRKRGSSLLLVARFVPGLSAATSTLAGTTGACAKRFATVDVIGTVVWVAVAVALGTFLQGPITILLKNIARFWIHACGFTVVALALVALVKYRRKRLWFQRNDVVPISR